MLSVDLNCDMGESSKLWPYHVSKDLALLEYVSSINIACAGHAGDRDTMKLLSEAAIKKNIAIGAHPSFPDKENFGRTKMDLSSQGIYETVLEQIHLLETVLRPLGIVLHHVKPHGALYNMAAADIDIANAICRAIIDVDREIVFYGLSGSKMILVSESMGLKTCNEVFADRTYRDDGSLTSRAENNAMITDVEKSIAQVLQMLMEGKLVTISGKEVPIIAETICIHGDGEQAITFAKEIHGVLQQRGIAIKAPVHR